MAALTISSPAIVAAPVTTPTAAALAILLPATADVTAPAVAATVPAAALALAAMLAIAPAISVKIHPPFPCRPTNLPKLFIVLAFGSTQSLEHLANTSGPFPLVKHFFLLD